MQGVAVSPKLRSCSQVKSLLKLEDYVIETPFHYRKFITRLRCGSNALRIEVGRWKNLDREERKCLVCGLGEVEDEVHFLLNCYVYDRERENMFNDIKD